MTFRPLPVMTVCVLVSLAILTVLGNWQWQRYSEKLEAANTEIEWESLFGTVVDEQVFFVSTIVNGRSAWKHVAVLEDSDRGDVVLATYYISFQVNAPDNVQLEVGREFDFEDGIFYEPEKPNFLTPPSSGDSYFSYEIDAMRARLPGALGARLRPVAFEPRLITVRDDAGDVGEIENPYANPVLADPLPPERHLGYALTWWGIAIALLVIYLVYHASVGRLRFGKTA